MTYINLFSRKVLFRASFGVHFRRFSMDDFRMRGGPWKPSINSPMLWSDKKYFAMRFGDGTILLFNRLTRKFQSFPHIGGWFLYFDHFLGMFPAPLKPNLVGALKPFGYFYVADLGSEFCGVYSRVRGSCFRLDEFKRIVDYFFVCFPQGKKYGSALSSILIFPFRGRILKDKN